MMKTSPSARSHRCFTFVLASMMASCALVRGASDHWPQWRGPNLNGTAQANDLPIEWSETRNVRWKTELPSWSGATPIVWEDKVFVMSPDQAASTAAAGDAAPTEPTPAPGGPRGNRGRDRGGGMDPGGQALLLFCLSREDGRVLWKREVDRGNQTHRKQNNTSPSPVTDGVHVWSFTGNGVLTCFDLAGQEQWERRLQWSAGKSSCALPTRFTV